MVRPSGAYISQGGPFKLKASFDHHYSLLSDGPLDREQVSEDQVQITSTLRWWLATTQHPQDTGCVRC